MTRMDLCRKLSKTLVRSETASVNWDSNWTAGEQAILRLLTHASEALLYRIVNVSYAVKKENGQQASLDILCFLDKSDATHHMVPIFNAKNFPNFLWNRYSATSDDLCKERNVLLVHLNRQRCFNRRRGTLGYNPLNKSVRKTNASKRITGVV